MAGIRSFARIARALAALALLLPLAPAAPAADPAQSGATNASTYQPPSRGKPRGRVGGGSRSAAAALPALRTLVPQHTGLTALAQPSLFYWLEGLPPAGAKLVFTLTNDEAVEPVVEAELPRPAAAGLQRIDLASFGVQLAPELEHEWSVALVVDPAKPSSAPYAVGWIERVAPPSGVAAGDASALAAHGLWYDAFAAAPTPLREQLLREVGLAPLTRLAPSP